MFSVAAINDARALPLSLEELQPTKEAQEACLAQKYQDALTDLQAGNLVNARVLLQSILEDPLILQATTSTKRNVSETIDSSPMLQLRFSTLKNLAETLHKQDTKYHSAALDFYLQAASIDREDVVLWNRLGTLACALGHLNIARTAFEQGLFCSPYHCMSTTLSKLLLHMLLGDASLAIQNSSAVLCFGTVYVTIENFNETRTYYLAKSGLKECLLLQYWPCAVLCMEKLVEVLIAIGDQEACHRIVKRLLKIVPRHPRAAHIDRVLKGYADASEIVQNNENWNYCLSELDTQRHGLDLLDPRHDRLAFSKKRQLDNEDQGEGEGSSKKRKVQTTEICLPDLSWYSILISFLEHLGGNVSLEGIKTSMSQQQNCSSFEKVLPSPAYAPLVNSFVAVVVDRSPMSIKKMAGVEGSELLTSQKVQILEQHRPTRSELNGLSIDETISNSPSKVVQLARDARVFESQPSTSLVEGHPLADPRLEDVSLSADLEHSRGQILVETSDHLRGADSLYDDELPSQERRITRLERIRTRRHDKDLEVDKAKDKSQLESFRQLLEPYMSSLPQDAGMSQSFGMENFDSRQNIVQCREGLSADSDFDLQDLAVQDGTVFDEEIEVKQFLEQLNANSGPYHAAHELLEKLAAMHCKHRISISNLLMLESITRKFSWTTRSRRCSLFLAEVCLDMFLSSSFADTSRTSLYLQECGFHLCRLVEHAFLNASVSASECRPPFPPFPLLPQHKHPWEGTDLANKNLNITAASRTFTGQESPSTRNFPESGIHGSIASKFSNVIVDGSLLPKVQHKFEVFNTSMDSEWSLWVQFHWLNGQWHMSSGRQDEAYQELKLCLAILENRAQSVQKAASVLFPKCNLEMAITPLKVKRKLYELQIDMLLKHEAAKMVEHAQFSEVIDLLVPVLLPEKDSDKAKLGYDETKRGIVDLSPEYVGLSMLISACENVNPPNLILSLHCHARKLEFLCSAVSDNTAGIRCKREPLQLDRSHSGLVDECEQGKGNEAESRQIAQEVKSISSCSASIAEQLGESGCMVSDSIQASLLREIQSLLLDLMCHYIKSQGEGRSTHLPCRSFNLQFGSESFVDACIAFCRLQHLDATATLEEQVSLLGTVHDLLAIHGLCCAGQGCEGGEGAFLKLAIKHLGTVEFRFRFVSGQPKFLKLTSGAADEDGLQIDKEDQKEVYLKQPSKQRNGSRQGPDSGESANWNQKEPVKTRKEEEAEETEKQSLELSLDSVRDQCFFCLYGLNLRGGLETLNQSDYLAEHKNTNRGDYETQEQCAGVYQYILPYAKACSKARLLKLRKVIRAVYKQFPNPPSHVLADRAVDHFLDDPEFDEEKLYEMICSGKSSSEIMKFALNRHTMGLTGQEKQTLKQLDMATDLHLEQEISKTVVPENACQSINSEIPFPDVSSEQSGCKYSSSAVPDLCIDHKDPYLKVYENLYHLVSEVEDISVSEKWAGFVLTKEGEEFVEQNAKLLKYDLCFNPLRLDSWYKLAKIYDEEVDLMLNDGSKNTNAIDWRNNTHLTRRIEISRGRTLRSLLMTLALSNTPEKQSEIHELLALVYYDCIQNVAPSYDQRSHAPRRDAAWISLCQMALKHFEGAYMHRPDWTHLFYMGKLCEKLCRPIEEAFDFYERAANMKSSAVDPIYRLHASRLKLLCNTDGQDVKVLQVLGRHCYVSSIREKVCSLLECLVQSYSKVQLSPAAAARANNDLVLQIRRQLFEDCLTVMKVCVEGELKHYHKARFRLAYSLCNMTDIQDMDRAKEELAFCFRSSRSHFTINMWEIDGSLRKIRRKAAHQTNLDVQMPESSRKFITCVRKYLVLYLSLCEKTGDIYTLERAFSSLKSDKKFSLCLDDLSRVALGKYIQALVRAICQADSNETMSPATQYSLLEKFFNLFMEYGASWSGSLETSLSEARIVPTLELSEDSIYGYIHRYLDLLENEVKVDIMEAINEKIRKRFKSFKLLASPTSEVCKHACLAWGRALCCALASVTPLPHCGPSRDNELNSSKGKTTGLIVDLHEDTFKASLYRPPVLQKESTDGPTFTQRTYTKVDSRAFISGIKSVPVRQATPENLERATALLRSTYVFYRDSLSGPFPAGISIFLGRVAMEDGSKTDAHGGTSHSVEALDISMPRKLLLWAFTLVHGRTGSVAEAVKYCEEHAKPRLKKTGMSGVSHPSPAVLLDNTPG